MRNQYLNPGSEGFQIALNSEIYVDKTMILSKLNQLINTNSRFVCMARPRRFGKSYVGDLICAYYSRNYNSRDLFNDLKFSQDPNFEQYLNTFDVIKIDLAEFYSGYPSERDNLMQFIASKIAVEFREEYPDIAIEEKYGLADMLQTVFKHTNRKFVIFIDEYDVLIREKAPKEQLKSYLDFLSSMFKGSATQGTIALAYLTGILPIVREQIESKLNNFSEYTFLRPKQFSEFMGFTEDETKQLCERYDMSFEECKYWYDGYKFKDGTSVLSPMSVSEAMKSHEYDDYWCQTSSFMPVVDAIKCSQLDLSNLVLRLVRGQHVEVDVKSFLNTVTDFHSQDDVLTYCIQLGYLAYDYEEEKCYIPNAEVRNRWIYVAENIEETHVVSQLLKASKALLRATIKGDTAAVAEGLETAHNAVCSKQGYNNEKQFQSAIIYAYYYAQNAYTLVTEFPTGKGFADVAFLPKYPTLGFPALIVELKKDKSTNTAMQQIEKKQYGQDLLHYRGNMLLVAVNYDAKKHTHTCEIKPFVAE